jgi:subtilisin family serine protease
LSIIDKILSSLPGYKYYSLDKELSFKTQQFWKVMHVILPIILKKPDENKYEYQYTTNIAEELNIKGYWGQEVTGKGVKVAIFDTGVSVHYNKTHSGKVTVVKYQASEEIEEEYTLMDFEGHGTAVASVISRKIS